MTCQRINKSGILCTPFKEREILHIWKNMLQQERYVYTYVACEELYINHDKFFYSVLSHYNISCFLGWSKHFGCSSHGWTYFSRLLTRSHDRMRTMQNAAQGARMLSVSQATSSLLCNSYPTGLLHTCLHSQGTRNN